MPHRVKWPAFALAASGLLVLRASLGPASGSCPVMALLSADWGAAEAKLSEPWLASEANPVGDGEARQQSSRSDQRGRLQHSEPAAGLRSAPSYQPSPRFEAGARFEPAVFEELLGALGPQFHVVSAEPPDDTATTVLPVRRVHAPEASPGPRNRSKRR